MFARILEFIPKVEKKEELFKVVRNEVLPILKKQPGFLEILPFVPSPPPRGPSPLLSGRRRGMQSAMSARCIRELQKS